MLKLWTNTDLLVEKNRSKVFPLLFDLHFVANKLLDQYYSFSNQLLDSKIVVIPLEYGYMLKEYPNHLKDLLKQAKETNKLHKICK